MVIAAISLALVTICIAVGCFKCFKRRGLCKKRNNGNNENEVVDDGSAGYGSAKQGTIQVAVTESSIDVEA